MLGGRVGACPEAGWGARGEAVDVTTEDDGASLATTLENRREFPALALIPGHLDGVSSGQMSGAHADVVVGGDTQPPALLDTGLRRERVALGFHDGCCGEHRVTDDGLDTKENY